MIYIGIIIVVLLMCSLPYAFGNDTQEEEDDKPESFMHGWDQ